MICVKTGCDIRHGKNIYHGDLFYEEGEWLLKGVPFQSKNIYYLERPDFPHDCKVTYIEFIRNTGVYGEFALYGMKPTKEFKEYVDKWSPIASSCFYEIDELEG